MSAAATATHGPRLRDQRIDEIQSALAAASERVETRLMEQAEAINRLIRTGRSTNRRLDAADR